MDLLKLCSPLMLDSGAFSAWNKGVEINFSEYLDFALEHEKELDSIVVLDSIPGSPGETKLSSAQVRDSAEKGWKNFQTMLKAGIPREKLIPVFHQNEEDFFLERMMEEAPYFGLSPANDRGTPEKIMWLDHCMNLTTDKDGFPKNKWHGFAVTSEKLMTRYPWYSADSASWRLLSAFGKILIAIKTPTSSIVGTYDVSDRKKHKPTHIDSLSNNVKNVVFKHIESKGFDIQTIRDSCIYRQGWNIIAFYELQKMLPVYPWSYKKVNKGLGII